VNLTLSVPLTLEENEAKKQQGNWAAKLQLPFRLACMPAVRLARQLAFLLACLHAGWLACWMALKPSCLLAAHTACRNESRRVMFGS
jgi:hypothetical protein